MFKKWAKVIFNLIPILLMIGLIPMVTNDYLLTIFYAFIIIIAFVIKRERKEVTLFFFGFFVMMACEYVFIQTGVERFERDSLFGIMPLWLPFLWGYGFVVMKRLIKILNF